MTHHGSVRTVRVRALRLASSRTPVRFGGRIGTVPDPIAWIDESAVRTPSEPEVGSPATYPVLHELTDDGRVFDGGIDTPDVDGPIRTEPTYERRRAVRRVYTSAARR
jgi:hypothetical protein